MKGKKPPNRASTRPFDRLRDGWWESAHAPRAVRPFAWLQADSVKAALSRPACQRVAGAVGLLGSDRVIRQRSAVESWVGQFLLMTIGFSKKSLPVTVSTGKQKEITMNIFKKLFSKGESFVPTPKQTVPGLEPIVVQAIENLYPKIEHQKQAFEYALKLRKGGTQTKYVLALLFYSQRNVKNLVGPGSAEWTSLHFWHDDIDPIFRNMKAAEKWVMSITKP